MPDDTLPMKYVKRGPYRFFKVHKPSSFISSAKTFAPFFKKASACACPIPEAPPVMKTVFPLYSSNSIVSSSKIKIGRASCRERVKMGDGAATGKRKETV